MHSAAVRRLAGSLLDPLELCHVIQLAAGMPERRHSVSALQNEKFLLGRSPTASDVGTCSALTSGVEREVTEFKPPWARWRPLAVVYITVTHF